jgi:hypothetical protein
MMGGWTGQYWGWERLVKTSKTLGTAALMNNMDQREGEAIDIYPVLVGDGLTE